MYGPRANPAVWNLVIRLLMRGAWHGGRMVGESIGQQMFYSKIRKKLGPAAADRARVAYRRTKDMDEATVAAYTTGMSEVDAEQFTANYYRSRAEG